MCEHQRNHSNIVQWRWTNLRLQIDRKRRIYSSILPFNAQNFKIPAAMKIFLLGLVSSIMHIAQRDVVASLLLPCRNTYSICFHNTQKSVD